MSDVKTKFKNKENKYKIYSECTKMPIIENEPSLTDIMNELKSFKKETNARLDKHDERFDSIEKRLDKHDKRFDSIDKRLDKHDKRFDSIEKDLKNDIKKIDTKLNNVIKLNNLKV